MKSTMLESSPEGGRNELKEDRPKEHVENTVFPFLPERGGFDHIRAYQEQCNSGAFSFAPSPPLRVKTLPDFKSRREIAPQRFSLPANLTKIRSTGKLSHVHSLDEFPIYGSNGIVEDQYDSEVSNSATPNFEINYSRHDPPEPTEQVERPELPSGLFMDPFSEYMLDRLARFRPLDGQSDPNAPLDFAHPYQATDETARQPIWTNWFSGRRQSGQTVQDNAPAPAGSPTMEQTSVQNGSSLFLPRNSPGIINNEPSPTALESTPRAEALEDIKIADNEGASSSMCAWCLC